MAEQAGARTKYPELKVLTSFSMSRRTVLSQSGNSPLADIMHLHKTIGNQAVQRLLKSGFIQVKLKIGHPNDIYEQEADRVAEQVMRMPRNKGGGVRTDGRSGDVAETARAKAFTVGSDIVFGSGEYAPGTLEAKRLLGHEVTHVLQQERGTESKRHMHGPSVLRQVHDKTALSPGVVMRKVRTSSPAVLSAFQALCPSAMLTSGQGGFIEGKRCGGVDTSQETCKCLCSAVSNRNLYEINVKTASWSSWPTWMHDWSFARLPKPSVWPNSGSNGSAWVIALPSASSGGDFGAFDPSGNCTPYPFERLLAHEICGHALGPPTAEQEYGDRPSHDLAIQIENDIAQEQGWPARGYYDDPKQGESYSQKSGDPKIVYKLKDGWHYQSCTSPPQIAPVQQHPRRRRRRRKRSSIPQQKITNTENVRLVRDPIQWKRDDYPYLLMTLPKGTPVEFLDEGADRSFNDTALEYQWWYVRVNGVEGWVMQVLLD